MKKITLSAICAVAFVLAASTSTRAQKVDTKDATQVTNKVSTKKNNIAPHKKAAMKNKSVISNDTKTVQILSKSKKSTLVAPITPAKKQEEKKTTAPSDQAIKPKK